MQPLVICPPDCDSPVGPRLRGCLIATEPRGMLAIKTAPLNTASAKHEVSADVCPFLPRTVRRRLVQGI